MRFLRYGIFVFIVTLLFCSYAHSGESLMDYYPLKNGNIWIYEKEGGIIIKEEAIVGGDGCSLETTVKIVCSDGSYRCLSVDSEGVKSHKEFGAYDTVIYPEPLMLFPFDIEDKKSYKGKQKYLVQEDNASLEGLNSYEIQFVGKEDVVVPAGEFADCIKILETSSWEEGETYGADKVFYWLARGIGIVKKVSDGLEYGDSGRQSSSYSTYEELKLTRAIVDGKVYKKADEE
ncbi:MAG: hypothetical protein V1699_00305 [Candidatus Omnitrophota bacterium]